MFREPLPIAGLAALSRNLHSCTAGAAVDRRFHGWHSRGTRMKKRPKDFGRLFKIS
jgi:hypothetical protein